MFCGPGSIWGGWHMGGWFMPGFLMVIFLGVIIWLLLRRRPAPSNSTLRCPHCSGGIQASYFRCPHCGTTLKHNCPNCSRIMEHDWTCCPYCSQGQEAPAGAQTNDR